MILCANSRSESPPESPWVDAGVGTGLEAVPSDLAITGIASVFQLLGATMAARKRSGGRKKSSGGRKSGGRKYGKAASKRVESAMRRRKRGTLKSGRGGKGGKVTSRKQAIAIGLSEARKKGAKVPRKKGGRKKSRR